MSTRTHQQTIADHMLKSFKDSLEEELNEPFSFADDELKDYRTHGEWQEEYEDDLRLRR